MKYFKLYSLVFALLVILLGVAGLYFKIEYSGWILAIGLFCGVCTIEKN